MKWYGWIPTLTGEGVFRYVYDEFIWHTKPILLISKSEKVHEKIIKFVKDELGWNIDVSTVIFTKRLYGRRKQDNIIIVQFDNKRYVRRIAILDGDFQTFIKDPFEFKDKIIAKTKSIKFIKDGLVEFDFDIIECYEESDVGIQFFRIIRDIYQTYDQDTFLKPVKTRDENLAKKELLRIYLNKIVVYQNEIKKYVDAPFWEYFNIFKYRDMENIIMQALGEILYGESFSELFFKDYVSRFKRAREYIQALHNRIKAEFTYVSLLLTLISVALAAGVGYMTTSFEIFLLFLLFPICMIMISSLFVYMISNITKKK